MKGYRNLVRKNKKRKKELLLLVWEMECEKQHEGGWMRWNGGRKKKNEQVWEIDLESARKCERY